VAITSLHYYFPWAMTALVRWSTFSLVTERKPNLHVSTDEWFAIADRDDLSYEEKIAAYLAGERRGAELAKASGQALKKVKVDKAIKLLDRADKVTDKANKNVRGFGLRDCV